MSVQLKSQGEGIPFHAPQLQAHKPIMIDLYHSVPSDYFADFINLGSTHYRYRHVINISGVLIGGTR